MRRVAIAISRRQYRSAPPACSGCLSVLLASDSDGHALHGRCCSVDLPDSGELAEACDVRHVPVAGAPVLFTPGLVD